jgi:hypothetical protein
MDDLVFFINHNYVSAINKMVQGWLWKYDYTLNKEIMYTSFFFITKAQLEELIGDYGKVH